MKNLPNELYPLVVSFFRSSPREVPWRKEVTPYHIWLSEIMCQQTRMEAVIPYYFRFLEKAPDIRSLALLSEDEANKLWEGLGYYSRARNLRKAAKKIMEEFDGVFPSKYEDILSLPGIGEYSAGAISSIAFQKKYASIDGNALRVLTRVNADNSDISLEATKKEYKKQVENILEDRPGDFNQGVMDIGALYCLPHGKPLCENCPLQRICKAHQASQEEQYPYKSNKLKKKEENITLFLVEENGKYLIHKRGNKGLLASLYEFKNVSGKLSKEEVSKRFQDKLISIEEKDCKDFVFTHKIWHMKAYYLQTKAYQLEAGEKWASEEELKSKYSLPSAFAQFVSFLF